MFVLCRDLPFSLPTRCLPNYLPKALAYKPDRRTCRHSNLHALVVLSVPSSFSFPSLIVECLDFSYLALPSRFFFTFERTPPVTSGFLRVFYASLSSVRVPFGMTYDWC